MKKDIIISVCELNDLSDPARHYAILKHRINDPELFDDTDPDEEIIDNIIANGYLFLENGEKAPTPKGNGKTVIFQHKTDGGAVYLTDNHRFSDATVVIRLDGKHPELIGCKIKAGD